MPETREQGASIHPTAVVEEGARLAAGVTVGPHSVIGREVSIEAGTIIGPHCVLDGRLEIGEGCSLSSHVSLGSPPQDLKYGGEPTLVRIGKRNTFREFVTVNRGTEGGGGVTVIGDENLLMTGAHVAHDCQVGSNIVFANNATLGGHVTVGDGATIGAFSAAHQFCRVGRRAFVGGYTVMTMDVLPFVKTVGSRGGVKAFGINSIGLERAGMSSDVISDLKQAFRIMRKGRAALPEAFATIRAELGGTAEVIEFVEFLETAREARGFHR